MRSKFWYDAALRFLIAAIAGWLGTLAHASWGGPFPGAVDLSSAIAFTATLLFGGPGLVGGAAGELVAWSASGRGAADALTLAAAHALCGAVAWVVFRYTRGTGRGLPNLRSYLWLFMAATLGGLLAAIVEGAALVQASPRATWLLWAGNLAGVMLLAPPILLIADHWLAGWRARIPDEEPARRVRLLRLRRGIEGGPATGASLEDTLVTLQAVPSLGRGLAIGGLLVVATTGAALPLTDLVPDAAVWLTMLYLVPVLWAAINYGLRGGVLAASAAGILFLIGRSLTGAGPRLGDPEATALYANVLALSLVGALFGAGQEREATLRDRLAESNRLLRNDLLRVVQALTGAIEAKDGYTEAHLRRVSGYALAVGERLGLGAGELEELRYASLLHDVGKIGVPDHLLAKQGPLSVDEAEQMQRHAEIGARILSNIDVLRDVAPLILHHQERFDGARDGKHPGYPLGLHGDAIPMGARIIAVVDAFDAMTSDRPYRAALDPAEAVEVLRTERGRQFDPRIVDCFLSVLAENPWRD
ncbi:MAG TPA: HD domain-containing phosphohydrolase [Thermoanaerobaculia bacterium]|nr:HD domain-containing phosphohydrolase [Thermoanaerobaculia bacterium]